MFGSKATVKGISFYGWAVMILLLLVPMILGFFKVEHRVKQRVALEWSMSTWSFIGARPKKS